MWYGSFPLPLVNLISVLFLSTTILVYICIPQLLNLFGKCILFYLTSLLCFFITLSYIQLHHNSNIPDKPCTALGYIIYFSSRLSFSWSNVISFDLYSSVRWAIVSLWKQNFKNSFLANNFSLFIQSATMKSKRMTDLKRLGFYMLYAFGLSSGMTALCTTIDSIPEIPIEFKPEIGKDACFLKST